MANLLTALRLLLVIPMALAFAQADMLAPALVLLLLLLAIASDYFDGKVARATNTASPRGMLFDHGTDFAFVTASLAGLAYAGAMPSILPLLIVIAFSQYVLDSYFLFRAKQLRMSFLGRWNGIFYFAPLLLVATARISMFEPVSEPLMAIAALIGVALCVSTIASIIDRAIAPFRSTTTNS